MTVDRAEPNCLQDENYTQSVDCVLIDCDYSSGGLSGHEAKQS
jgi:hypothetical protein